MDRWAPQEMLLEYTVVATLEFRKFRKPATNSSSNIRTKESGAGQLVMYPQCLFVPNESTKDGKNKSAITKGIKWAEMRR